MGDVGLREIHTITDRVEGWLGKREGPYLYQLARCASRLGVLVEIGSWQGKSTIWLGKGSEAVDGSELYAIDPHVGGPDQEKIGLTNVNTEEAFRENIRNAGLEARVIPIVMTSMEALVGWHKTIGMLWIDGDHSYEAVSTDFYGWLPFVAAGGVIALHDTYSWEGVRKLVDDEILPNPSYRVLGQVDGILAIQKAARITLMDRLKAKTTMRLRRIYNHARMKRSHWRALPRKFLRGFATGTTDRT
jgi:MMP 1-O-methyltransferase